MENIPWSITRLGVWLGFMFVPVLCKAKGFSEHVRCQLLIIHTNKPKRKIILYCIHDFAMELKCNVFQTRVMGPLTKSR